MAKGKGQIVDTSKSGGRGVHEFWLDLLEENERLYKQDPDNVMSDDDMAEEARACFPDRAEWSKLLTITRRWRNYYNAGMLDRHRKEHKKYPTSYRYVRVGGDLMRIPQRKRRKKNRPS